jgi:hypothetical protein
LEQALRVVLGRLGNFPPFKRAATFDRALADLPPRLVAEELALSDDAASSCATSRFF